MRTTHHRLPLLAAPAVLLLAGCAAGTPPEADPHDAGTSWSYEGAGSPERWGALADEYGTCGTGERQSPIDLPAARGGADLDLVGSGAVRGLTADNGHTVQFTADDGASTTVAGEELDLVQMHFHAGSEHTVDGEPADAEFHFVHADDRGALTVVGVLAERGAHNPAYESYLAGATAGAGRESTVDVEAMLPASRSFATYEGSLTTPPCTEGVRWIVLEDPIELGADQLADLEAAHVENARPVQPLGDRTVRHTL
ncbi:carbonic anhydrase family protein [Curtobacterium sp. MCJR17_020]|uniref:carbonic anhydrase n=1 Tax=Curtobacterium sp. MCJR17_020 TaxID=2175619 RepID=UPI0011B551EA|nr:carbonic anhydrase family protein [Curtobacterium sp. MCJR17_020]WIE71974.1 carbonic anhydrase family protein [Curtobacterium sp. MCJR17_020]